MQNGVAGGKAVSLCDLRDGECFVYGEKEWVALDGGNALTDTIIPARLCLMKHLHKNVPFDLNGVSYKSNDWRSSTVRQYLNEGYISAKFLDGLISRRAKEVHPNKSLVEEELIEYTNDLTTDDGLKDYGTCEDLVFFLLSASDYRRNRHAIPSVDHWWWLITPYSISYPGKSSSVCRVRDCGAIGVAHPHYGNGGLRPAIYLHENTRVVRR